MTANSDTHPIAHNAGVQADEESTTKTIDGHSELQQPVSRLSATVEHAPSDAGGVTPIRQDTLIPINHPVSDGLEDWLRYGCERVIQRGGRTVCPPVSTDRQPHKQSDKPSQAGYHQSGSCVNTEKPDGCLVYDLFEADDQSGRLSHQLVLDHPERHLLELTLKSPQPADIGLLTEAIHYLNSRNVPVPCVGNVRVQCINPLYNRAETLHKHRCHVLSDEMAEKHKQWREVVHEEYVTALQTHLVLDDELNPPIRPEEHK